jgi:hypothetical protein
MAIVHHRQRLLPQRNRPRLRGCTRSTTTIANKITSGTTACGSENI